MKYSILTFVFNNYDSIKEPLEISPNCEYVLITDNKNLTSKNWKIKYLPDYFNEASGFTKSFYVRYHPYEFVSNDICIVLDGSILIKKNLDKLINDFIKSNSDICLSVHALINNPFDEEYNYFVMYRKYNYYQSLKNKCMVKAIGYNEKNKSYIEANIKICKKSIIVDELHNFVWNCLLKISPDTNNIDRLDQTILSAVITIQFPELKTFLICRQAIESDYLLWKAHNKNKSRSKTKINYNNLWFRNKKIKPYILK